MSEVNSYLPTALIVMGLLTIIAAEVRRYQARRCSDELKELRSGQFLIYGLCLVILAKVV